MTNYITFERKNGVVVGDLKNVIKTLRTILRHIRDGQYVIAVYENIRGRSSAQNRIFWKWCSIIGSDLGYTKEEMHDYFVSPEFYVRERCEILGVEYTSPVHTSSLNEKEMRELLDRIDRFASGLGIRLPNRNDSQQLFKVY